MSEEGFTKEQRRPGSNRVEKLLGIASGPPPPEDAAGDLWELREEDVWGGAESGGRSCSGHDAVLPQPHGSIVAGLPHRMTAGVRQTPPVNVPHWSSILRMGTGDRENDMILLEEESMVPPHEYVARQQAMNATALFDRRLKSEDLTRRNAVWSRTGFLD